MGEMPCNCYHSREDHRDNSKYAGGIEMYGWCLFSEYGQCPCDRYTPMDNLEYLEWKAETNGK